MPFTRIKPEQFTSKITLPDSLAFTSEQVEYIRKIVLDIEKQIEKCYRESRRVAAHDGNPQREVVNLDGASGTVRVDLVNSQLSHGIPVLVYAASLNGDVSIEGFDNAFNWTMVHVVNRDTTGNVIKIPQNAEVSVAATVSLGNNGSAGLIQVENAPVWVLTDQYVSSA